MISTGLGVGLRSILGQFAVMAGFPFRIMWLTPLLGGLMVLVVSIVAAALSVRPVVKLQPVRFRRTLIAASAPARELNAAQHN
ncbi:hypothetical protein CupriaWKF_30445 [Cupriavidus sp. WKF15]|uniref:hypothetical protein n=1 Tax=Cupriavidus sp. WKF15 TaxID=3032282 RepID=UPI0023E25110|nr:hypothetical protein [Cupriavidus sp. WKF15]WER50684.1 hypothetical protein CupriaWKF_30445 [Cupriavidus sp. WKF15]